MTAQFAAAPIAWALVITQESDIPALRKGPDSYPVIGWAYNAERSGGPLVTWISYKGRPVPLEDVLEDLRDAVIEQSRQLGHAQVRGNLSYTLVPV